MRAGVPTTEARETFLERLREGQTHAAASRNLLDQDGNRMTGTRFKRFERRDPEFGAAVEEAKAEGKESLVDRIRDRMEDLALHVNTPSERMLIQLAEAHLPEFAYRRTRRTEATGQVDVLHRLQLDPEKLALIPQEKLLIAIEALEEAAKDPADVIPLRELTAGDGKA